MVINDEMEHFMELNNSKIVEIRAHLISEDWGDISLIKILINNSNIHNYSGIRLSSYFKSFRKSSRERNKRML